MKEPETEAELEQWLTDNASDIFVGVIRAGERVRRSLAELGLEESTRWREVFRLRWRQDGRLPILASEVQKLIDAQIPFAIHFPPPGGRSRA